MYFSTLTTLLFAASTLALPVDESTATLHARTAPSTNIMVRGWNTTTLICDLKNAHSYGEMGPAEDVWGNGGNYSSYSVSRDLAKNETLELYATSGGQYCGTLLFPISGLKAGCYQTGTNEMFSCMKMTTTS